MPYEALDGDFSWKKSRTVRREGRGEGWSVAKAIKALSRRGREVTRALVKMAGGDTKTTRLVRKCCPSGDVLDVGCGRGRSLRKLSSAYVPFGIEVQADCAARADRRFRARGGRVIHATALEGLRTTPDARFDCLVMRSFLEHEVQPRELLAEAWRVVRPDGGLLIKVPNFGSLNRRILGKRWPGLKLPYHVNYFTPESLRRLVTEAGFEVIRFNILYRLPFSDSMWMIARKKGAIHDVPSTRL
ncbi:MAG: class I SAM-dependent methyltransferase [Planctomycetota bacterium]